MDKNEKEVNVTLAELENIISTAGELAEKCEAANVNFPISTVVHLNQLLVKVCRENTKLIFNLRERVARLEEERL